MSMLRANLMALSASMCVLYADAMLRSQNTPADPIPGALARVNNDNFAKFTPEQALAQYHAATPEEKKLAAIISANSIRASKVILTAREKWGKAGETLIAHALNSDTDADDAHATIRKNGEHAEVVFLPDTGVSNVKFILVGGEWKIDASNLTGAPGDPPGTALAGQAKFGTNLDRAEKALAKNNFAKATDLVAFLNPPIDPPATATAPAASQAGAEAPREFLARTDNDHMAKMTVDEVAALWDATTAAQKNYAKISANGGIELAKLLVACREKWGKASEKNVAHLLMASTADDDSLAEVVVSGEHATVHYKYNKDVQFSLVLRNGKWKLDMAFVSDPPGSIADEDLKLAKDTTAMYQKAHQALAQNSFKSADELLKYLHDEQEKLAPATK